MSRLPRLPLIACLAFALAAVGCKQGLGERCEQNSDCSSGFCTKAAPSAEGGRCCPSTGCESTGTAGTTGTAGDNGAAGTTGTAGDNGAAGTTGAGGASGAGGGSGAAGAGGASGAGGLGGVSGAGGAAGALTSDAGDGAATD